MSKTSKEKQEETDGQQLKIRKEEGFGGRELVTVQFWFTVTALMGLFCSSAAVGVCFWYKNLYKPTVHYMLNTSQTQ